MSWKDNLRPASFRGIPFYIDSSQYTGGRRVAFHEFPDRDKPYSEDLGKVGNTFKIEGYLLGDEYFEQKNQIKAAAEKYGAGELIHPYFGTMQVQCGAFSIDESTGEGRVCKISFQFYDAGSKEFPKVSADKLAALSDKADIAKQASKAAFDKKFSIKNLPGHIVETARGGITKAMNTFQTATKDVRTGAAEIATLSYNIRNTKAQLNDLLQAPDKLSQRLLDSFNMLTNAVVAPNEKRVALSSFTGFQTLSTVSAATPTRAAEAQNSNAIDSIVTEVAVASAAQSLIDSTFDSVEDATEVREELSGQIETILESTTDDDVFNAYSDLNAALVVAIPNEADDLPLVEIVVLPETEPSLVAAYDLFGDTKNETDIVVRNAIVHPGFVPGGVELEILNDA